MKAVISVPKPVNLLEKKHLIPMRVDSSQTKTQEIAKEEPLSKITNDTVLNSKQEGSSTTSKCVRKRRVLDDSESFAVNRKRETSKPNTRSVSRVSKKPPAPKKREAKRTRKTIEKTQKKPRSARGKSIVAS